MYDVRTKEGLQLRIHKPEFTGVKLPLMIFFVGIGERGLDINKVDNVGPLWFVNNPDPDVNVNYIAAGPLNESGNWDYWEVASALNYCLEAFADVLDYGSIHIVGHSLGGQAVWGVGKWRSSDYQPKVQGKELHEWVASITAISPISQSDTSANLIAETGIPGWAFHAQDDPVTSAIATSNIVNAINTAANQQLWKKTIWGGTSHATVAKVFNDTNWDKWWRMQRKQIGVPAQTVTETNIINGEARFKTASGVYSIPVTKIE